MDVQYIDSQEPQPIQIDDDYYSLPTPKPKSEASPVLTKKHKEDRLKWARDKVTWDEAKWATCVFSDEKMFNLDGLDGLQYYDLRKRFSRTARAVAAV
ncbi:unnamed protein product [Phytophthora lilii]|uniref:Unnamed protein product n=1 Tax=Phytophthora lilii TaxID=2077276 RepID=A0A9W6WY17_9STRA|nr:unnamed protein product [Phytophthora lilii]